MTPNHWAGMFDTAPIEVPNEPPTTQIPIWHGKPPLTVVPAYREPSVVEDFDYALWLPIAAVVVALTVLIAWWMQ